MAAGYRWLDALEANKSLGHRSELEGQQTNILNAAAFMLWREYNWACYMRRLPPFWLVPGVSKYGTPYYAIPGELHSLKDASLWDGDTNEKLHDLKLLRDRPETDVSTGMPNVITVEHNAYSPVEFRLFPAVSSNIDSSTYMVRGYYKRFFDRIDTENISVISLSYPHMYFPLVCKAVKYCMLEKLSRPEAGQVQTSKDGRVSYTGVLAEYKAMVNEAIEDESLRYGASTVTPEEPFYLGY